MTIQASNDNYTAVAPGFGFCPEMGERHDGTALFVIQVSHGGYHVKWETERHADAVATFKTLKVKPRDMHEFVTVKGGRKWSCGLTWAAGRKLAGSKYAVLETVLD